MSQVEDNAVQVEVLDQAAESTRNRMWSEPVKWWLKLVIQPVLLLLAGGAVIAGLGVAQRTGWIAASGSGSGSGSSDPGKAGTSYICPMLCTPPQSEPGRCPVCKMELVPATNSGKSDPLAITVDPAARRVANIQIAKVRAVPVVRKLTTVGRLTYDEGSMKTLAAYIDGRLEKMYADYTGVTVKKGDQLGVVYSPRLYVTQVEYLKAREAQSRARSSSLPRIDLAASARRRLLEAGMVENQIQAMEKSGKANSRLPLVAPIGGTVIEKMAEEGQYVKEGQPIYKLANLSNVWLMLEMFPEDAALVHCGQRVVAEVQSLPGKAFTGRVAFVDTSVSSSTRTVDVRVVIPNSDGQLKPGDYATAVVSVPVDLQVNDGKPVRYDPELAGKFISPRHPHIISSKPGKCPLCGIDLIPASELGFTSTPTEANSLVVPRNAVLMAGNYSVLYVETEPGRFEIRNVELGASTGDDIVIVKGVSEGEIVATRGNFLIDSQMQLAGNPSLIDPTRAAPADPDALNPEALQALEKLPEADRKLAHAQRICPVTKLPLGSMGAPIKLDIKGKPVFICCAGCEDRLRKSPDEYLKNLEEAGGSTKPAIKPKHAMEIAKLPPGDQPLATKQHMCPVADFPLGSMGMPIKVDVKGKPVFLCCEGCRDRLLKEPAKYLAKLATAAPATKATEDSSGLPEITGPVLIEPDSSGDDLPPISAPGLIEPEEAGHPSKEVR